MSSPSSVESVPLQFLKGVGPRKAEALKNHGITTVLDLFFHIPRRYIDRSTILPISRLAAIARGGLPFSPEREGTEEFRQDITVIGRVLTTRVLGTGKKARFIMQLGDQTGVLQCVWFGGAQYWRRAFHEGELLAVSGQPTLFRQTVQLVHPAFDRLAAWDDEDAAGSETGIDWENRLNTGGLVPLYPSGQDLERVGLDSGGFRRIIGTALKFHLGSVGEVLPEQIVRSRSLPALQEAIRAVHFPSSGDELQRGLRRMKFEELFLFQLKLGLKRQRRLESDTGISFQIKSPLARKLVDSLPFSLTAAQVRVIKEITTDMASPRPMNRLLQGDVGSGKTVVALIAMLIAVENGYQCVFAAPTEILAEQHFKTLRAIARDVPVSIRLLVGAQRSKLRSEILEDMRCGTAQIVVGTHALFEKEVSFARLGLVVIDEQHRFGVLQRAALRGKGEHPDVLVMTATPIPRTLSLTLFGDLEVSIIDTLPVGRQPIKTVLKRDDEKDSVFGFVREEVRKGRQAYFVYPLVEESEKVDLKAATVHFDELRKRAFPELRLGLIHGRMGTEEKESVMQDFRGRKLDILVATTVIEVGIDIPNATVMVIENAERFGLAQLHQLRGRVGRGSEQSFCVLVAASWIVRRALRVGNPLTKEGPVDPEHAGERRLAAMAQTNDGFAIAELDLQLRGPGDFFGTRQSGVPEFKVADLLSDSALLEAAREDAFAVLSRDPHLTDAEQRPLASYLRTHAREEFLLAQVG